MITPLDIQKKQFSKSFRGLSEREVQSFLQEIFQTLEKHINENAELKDKMTRNIEEIQKYRNIEKTLSETLVIAQRTSEDLMVNARKEADQIILQAKLQAKAIEEQSKRDLHMTQSQRMMMEKDLEGFRLRMEGLLRAQLEVVGHYKPDLIMAPPQPQIFEPKLAPVSAPEPNPEPAPIFQSKQSIFAQYQQPNATGSVETIVQQPIAEFANTQIEKDLQFTQGSLGDSEQPQDKPTEPLLQL